MNAVVTGIHLQGIRGSSSDNRGFCNLLALPPGTVSLRVSHTAYQSVIVTDVHGRSPGESNRTGVGGIGGTDGVRPPIGRTATKCEIAEVILYDTVLLDSLRRAVENYLAESIRFNPERVCSRSDSRMWCPDIHLTARSIEFPRNPDPRCDRTSVRTLPGRPHRLLCNSVRCAEAYPRHRPPALAEG